jgi:hypothetical protein
LEGEKGVNDRSKVGADARARGVESSGAWGVDAAVGVPSTEASSAPRPGLLSLITDKAAGLELFGVEIGSGALTGARLTECFWGLANRDGGEEIAMTGKLRPLNVAGAVPWLVVDDGLGFAKREGGDESVRNGELREELFE